MRARIPVTIVTGFLGAGKTSLLRHLVLRAAGRRLALLINEFGELGIDRELLLGCADCAPGDVVELANGCICCAVADDFLPAMEALVARDPAPDHIVIETSGLALPKPLLKALAWDAIRTRVTVDGVIAVIDAPALASGQFVDRPLRAGDHDNPLEEVFTDQLNAADLIVLNKIDLIDDAARERLTGDLATRARPVTKLIAARHGAVPVLAALGLGAAAEDDLATRPSHIDAAGEHDHDDFESFAVELPPVIDRNVFAVALTDLLLRHDVLRAKGFAVVPGKALRLAIQAVGPRVETYFDRKPEHAHGRLVVIGRKGMDRAAIAAALAPRHAAAAD
jgi:cobalamin biosynthesis protein CobW